MGIHKNPVAPNDLYTQATKSVSGSLCVYSFVELALLVFVHGSANCLTPLNILIHLVACMGSLNIVLLLEKKLILKSLTTMWSGLPNLRKPYQHLNVFPMPHISRFVGGY